MWHRKYIQQGLEKPFNDAVNYKVRVERNFLPANKPHFSAICVHHLLPHENTGGHNLYIDVLDLNNTILRNAVVKVTNTENGFISRPRLDKGEGEPATNVPIWFSDTFKVEVEGIESDVVLNIHARHDDEFGGNQRGHHSFYVVFKYSNGLSIPIPPDSNPPQLPPLKELFTLEELRAIENYPFLKIRELVR